MSGFISGLAGGAVGDLLNLAGNLKLGPWAWGLQPATWRGHRFAVRGSEVRRGRRVAVHEYVFRDEVWVEDLGRGTRTICFTGFLVGTDVYAQRDAMLAAAEVEGPGELVHPSLGTIRVSLVEFSCGERADLGRVVELGFTFVESAPQPEAKDNFATQLKTVISAVQTGLATFEDFMGTVRSVGTALIGGGGGILGYVSNLLATAKGTVGGFLTLASKVSGDGALPVNAVRGLPGNNGRYALTGLSAVLPATATPASVLAGVTVNRAAVTASSGAVAAVSEVSALAGAIRNLTESIRALAGAPRDAIRLLIVLASYNPPPPQQFGAAAIGIVGFVMPSASGSWALTSRTATATYLDAAGVLRLAPAGQVRPLFVGGVLQGVYAESASSNLVTNSLGMAGWVTNGVPDSVITIGSSDVAKLYAGALVAKCVMNTGGALAGFKAQTGQTVSTVYAVSLWVYIPAGTSITAATFRAESGATSQTTLVAADVSKVGVWQRLSATYTASATSSNLVLRVTGASAGSTIYATCIMQEPGAVVTSYIPTSSGVVARDADVITYQAAVQTSTAPIGAALATLQVAIAALCRRSALGSLARACAAYQPSSYDDATAVLQAVLTVLDAEITVAADMGDSLSFAALRDLRAAIILDLTTRGADLPRLATITRGAPLPSLVVAYDVYGDASRSEDLIARVDPPNPLFMPTRFRALSSSAMSGTTQTGGAASSGTASGKRRPEDVVSLTINPTNANPETFIGWKSVRITRRLLGCPSDFDLELTEIYPGRPYLIFPDAGQECQIKIGEELVMTGYIDRYHASISPHGHTVRVQGRSKCQDVVDCHITPDVLNGQEMTTSSLVELGTKLCEKYGITVKSLTGNNIPVSLQGSPGTPATFAANLQETPWEIMEQVARSVGVLVYDDVDGNLLFADVGQAPEMQSGFRERVNVQEASVTYAMDQRFQQYFPCTQSVNFFGGAMGYGSQNFPVVWDKGVPRFRQRIVVCAQATADGHLVEQRAKWEKARRYGQSQAVRITADSWRDKDDKGNPGKLWAPNAYAALHLPALHLSPPEKWVIGEVTYSIDVDRGTTADLVLMPREAFLPQPEILSSFLHDPGRTPPPATAAGTGGSTPANVNVGGALTNGPNGTRIYPDGTVLYPDGSKIASDGFVLRGPDTIKPDGTRIRAPVNSRP